MPRIPGYRLHKASKQATVKLGGKVHYLGKHGSPTSNEKYNRLIAEWAARNFEPPPDAPGDLTIIELLDRFRLHAVEHYRGKDAQPTSELVNFDQAMRPLLLLYSDELVNDFGPKKLKAVRELMVKGFVDRTGKRRPSLSRNVVNRRVGRLKEIFRWAVEEELASGELYHALKAVKSLQMGRSRARESKPIKPVAEKHVDATLPHMPAVVADMVRVQRLTGCRPGEVTAMRPCDFDRSVDPWVYRPERHKGQHRGRNRTIFIGPRAQQILLPYLLRDAQACCFSPAESERKRRDAQHAARITPDNAGNRPGTNCKRRPQRRPRDRYTKDSYGRAIRRASDAADRQAHRDDPNVDEGERIVPVWKPNQLRHSAATEIRKRFGLEAAQNVLGHSEADVTQIYAERDQALASKVAREIG